MAGGISGILLAWWLLRAIVPLLPPQLPGLEAIGLHRPVLLFALGVSLLVMLLAGMLPSRLASRIRLSHLMQQGSHTVSGGGALRNALVVAQIAFTLVLVFAGGLLVRSLVATMKVDPGFSAQGVLTMHLQVTRAKYPTDPQIADYYLRLVESVKTVPGVVDAGMINLLPFSEQLAVHPVEFEGKSDEGRPAADGRSITPGYFAAMGIQLIRGRDFSVADKEVAPPVGIIDEQLARRAFGNADPLGKRLRFGIITNTSPWLEIVGVVSHIRNDSLENDPRPQIYWPNAQQRPEAQQTLERGALVVRTAGHPESFSSAVIAQIRKENPDQPVYDVRSMNDWLDRSLQSRNLLTLLVTLFGVSSLLLASLGLYGVISYGTGLRRREFAIRTALGARPGEVQRLVLAQTIRLWMSGSAIGLIAAWPVGQALRNLLFGVGSMDVVALTAAPLLMFITALLAGIGPARRSGRIDPAVVLRSE
jgi:putative ABC transport system permease protein